MIDLKDKKLNEKLKKLEKQKIPTVDDIKEENKIFEKEEKSFLQKFFKKIKKKNKK